MLVTGLTPSEVARHLWNNDLDVRPETAALHFSRWLQGGSFSQDQKHKHYYKHYIFVGAIGNRPIFARNTWLGRMLTKLSGSPGWHVRWANDGVKLWAIGDSTRDRPRVFIPYTSPTKH